MFYVNSWQLMSILGMTFVGQASMRSASTLVDGRVDKSALWEINTEQGEINTEQEYCEEER